MVNMKEIFSQPSYLKGFHYDLVKFSHFFSFWVSSLHNFLHIFKHVTLLGCCYDLWILNIACLWSFQDGSEFWRDSDATATSPPLKFRFWLRAWCGECSADCLMKTLLYICLTGCCSLELLFHTVTCVIFAYCTWIFIMRKLSLH